MKSTTSSSIPREYDRREKFLAVVALSVAWIGVTTTPLHAQLEPVATPPTATDI